MIKKIEKIVEDACLKKSNIFGYGIWTHHITRVVENGKRLAKIFKANSEIVEIAALLHDYASVKDQNYYKEHHIYGQIEAEKILKHFNYTSAKIEAVKHCIATHRGSILKERNSIEAECLANTDAMTHIEQVPSLLYSAYVYKKMNIDDGTKWLQQKLERSWNKLNEQVKKLMQKKYEASLITLNSGATNL